MSEFTNYLDRYLDGMEKEIQSLNELAERIKETTQEMLRHRDEIREVRHDVKCIRL